MKRRNAKLAVAKANVKYKDTIFRWLFSDERNLLSLYNAVTGKDYKDSEALDIVTLENAVYMGMKNDLAFVLESGRKVIVFIPDPEDSHTEIYGVL